MTNQNTGDVFENEKNRFANIAENAPVLIWICDTDQLCTWFNKFWLHWTGRSLEQELGNGWIQGVHPDDLQRYLKTYSQSFAARKDFYIEYRLRNASGIYRWIIDHGIPHFNDEKVFDGYTGACIEIHDQKMAAENELKNLKNLFKEIPDIMCTLSGPNHVFVYVNEAHIKVLQFDATGKSFREAQPESVEIPNVLDTVYRTGKTAKLFEIPVTLAGRVRYFNSTYAARRDSNDQIDGIMSICTEVTEVIRNRKELEQAKDVAEQNRLAAEAATESKNRFLANISHELRTPISAVVGFSDLLRGQLNNNPFALDYIDRISRNAGQLGRLIDELLDISKIEAEKLEIECEPVNLDALLEDIFSTLRLRAQEKNIEIKLNWLTEKPTIVNTDPLRFSQILTNIVGNAIKFTPQGTVQAEFFYLQERLKIRIIDSGIGLTIDQQARIFEPFVQADSSVNRKYGGTGLGLALSKNLARLLGGDLVLEQSIIGQGTIFAITIALKKDSVRTKVIPQQNIELSSKPLEGKKILIIDDSPDNRMIANMFLKIAGAQCEEATNGQEGIELTHQKDFDVVLMDIQMPVLDGYEAMDRLKKQNFKKPVLALTAHAFKEEKQRCINAGFSGYLTKPINREQLIRSVHQLMN